MKGRCVFSMVTVQPMADDNSALDSDPNFFDHFERLGCTLNMDTVVGTETGSVFHIFHPEKYDSSFVLCRGQVLTESKRAIKMKL